jgi:hypothetical protein
MAPSMMPSSVACISGQSEPSASRNREIIITDKMIAMPTARMRRYRSSHPTRRASRWIRLKRLITSAYHHSFSWQILDALELGLRARLGRAAVLRVANEVLDDTRVRRLVDLVPGDPLIVDADDLAEALIPGRAR